MLEAALKKYWGFDSFRLNQRQIIEHIMEGKDALALLPTGGGKSICYQIPAILKDGVTIVISPLIALMRDQVEHLHKKGISATYLSSGMSRSMLIREYENTQNGKYKLLYISPERASSSLFKDYFKNMNCSLIAVDEAHCVSQWGYDFRPEYLNIYKLKEIVNKEAVPILALTASATSSAIEQIKKKLKLESPKVFSSTFSRKNLNYLVLKEENKWERILKICRKVKGSGLIYLRSRKGVRDLSSFLMKEGISSAGYHAGLESSLRHQRQVDWQMGKIRVMCCTNAFGMGIDKNNVRFVIHPEAPPSIEDYYQEAGRAGRDEKKAYCIALTSKVDKQNALKRFDKSQPNIAEIERCYEAVCNHLQIAFNSGNGMHFPFAFLPFCESFELNVSKALVSFQILASANYLRLDQRLETRSRIMFLRNGQEVYDYQLRSAKLKPLISSLLRLSASIFDKYVYLDERKLSESLKIDERSLVSILKKLEKDELIDYLEKTDKAELVILQDRPSSFNIDDKELQNLFESKRKRIEDVYEFLSEVSLCREHGILSYFSEDSDANCGNCDVCRLKRKTGLDSDELLKIKKEIRQMHGEQGLSFSDIIATFNKDKEEQVISIIRSMMDNDKL